MMRLATYTKIPVSAYITSPAKKETPNPGSTPSDPGLGGGASPIYMQNNQATRNGGQNNILGNQEPAAAGMGGAALIGSQIVQGAQCAGPPW